MKRSFSCNQACLLDYTRASLTTGLLTFLVALFFGTLYAALLGLVTYPLRASLISWPIWIVLFWFLIWRFKLLRFAGFLAVLPLSILTFEVVRTTTQPSIYAFQYLVLDRSHFKPDILITSQPAAGNAGASENKAKEIYIGKDGFRADPKTRQGNPARCHDVLIGDSMIYGFGLPYSDTLRPVLQAINVDACVFGVTGNSPIDYLATLAYVQNRIENHAQVAIYIYVYNDFVSLTKYLESDIRGLSPSFAKLTALVNYYDDWRRTTFVQGSLRKSTATPKPAAQSWHLKIGKREIEVYWPHNPSDYHAVRPLNHEERMTFQFFLQRLRELVDGRPWRVSVVFIPDNDEMLANLAHSSSTFQDLDPRRVEGLKICAALWSDCSDLTPHLYKRVIAEAQSPYSLNDRHLSLFGNRVLAEHYVSMAKLDSPIKAPNQSP
jgi:hypothetical protein